MKPGMTLLELVLVIAISSLLSMALYNSFFITGKIAQRSESRMDFDVRSATLYTVINRDMQSIVIPRSFDEPAKKEAAPPAPQKEQKNNKELKDLFTLKRLADGKQIISFISTHYFFTEFHQDQVLLRPRIGRVVYHFELDVEHEGSYILFRQEAPNLSLKAFEKTAQKPIQTFEVVRGIKAWKVQSRYPVEFKTPPKVGQKREYKTVDGWPIDKLKNAPRIPQFITITIELWHDDYQTFETFEMPLEIVSFYASVMDIQEEKKPVEQKKEVNAQTFQELANKVQDHLAKTIGHIPGLKITMHRLK